MMRLNIAGIWTKEGIATGACLRSVNSELLSKTVLTQKQAENAELPTVVFLTVNAETMPAKVVISIPLANTASWETSAGSGLPLLLQVVQVTPGPWISTSAT